MKSILMFLLMLIAINASSQDDAQRMIQRVERDGQKPDNSRYYLYEDKMIEFFKANNWQDEVVSIKEIWVEKPDQGSYYWAQIRTKNSGGAFYIHYDPLWIHSGKAFIAVERYILPPNFKKHIDEIDAKNEKEQRFNATIDRLKFVVVRDYINPFQNARLDSLSLMYKYYSKEKYSDSNWYGSLLSDCATNRNACDKLKIIEEASEAARQEVMSLYLKPHNNAVKDLFYENRSRYYAVANSDITNMEESIKKLWYSDFMKYEHLVGTFEDWRIIFENKLEPVIAGLQEEYNARRIDQLTQSSVSALGLISEVAVLLPEFFNHVAEKNSELSEFSNKYLKLENTKHPKDLLTNWTAIFREELSFKNKLEFLEYYDSILVEFYPFDLYEECQENMQVYMERLNEKLSKIDSLLKSQFCLSDSLEFTLDCNLRQNFNSNLFESARIITVDYNEYWSNYSGEIESLLSSFPEISFKNNPSIAASIGYINAFIEDAKSFLKRAEALEGHLSKLHGLIISKDVEKNNRKFKDASTADQVYALLESDL
ncbi:MAG: hypothetical protein KA807_06380 [Prolixibacteraceae bacterium]|jgi:hypothetical protein|nr:hypothetical protein [Prolixibacteraceae bacterium]